MSPGSTARQSITTGARQEPDSPDSLDTCQSTVPDTPDSKVGPHLDSHHVRPLSGGVRHVKQKPTARQPDSPTVAEQPDSSRQSSTVADSSTVRALDSGVYSYTSFLRARTYHLEDHLSNAQSQFLELCPSRGGLGVCSPPGLPVLCTGSAQTWFGLQGRSPFAPEWFSPRT